MLRVVGGASSRLAREAPCRQRAVATVAIVSRSSHTTRRGTSIVLATRRLVTSTSARERSTAVDIGTRAVRGTRWAENPVVKKVRPIIGHAAYIGLATGFLMTDIFTLRLLLVGGYSALSVFHALQAKPLMIPLRWSIFFVGVNLGMAIQLAYDSWPVTLTKDEEALYECHFPQLTPKQFRVLMAAGERVTFKKGALLTREREPCDQLYLLIDGRCEMTLNGECVASINGGGFMNTLAFTQAPQQHRRESIRRFIESAEREIRAECKFAERDHEHPRTSLQAQWWDDRISAYATWQAQDEITCLVWPVVALRDLLHKDEKFERCMHHVLVCALMQRLLHSRDGANVQVRHHP